MKKLIIGSILGGLILFIWQFLSFALLDLHRPAMDYTPKQEEVLKYLSSQFTESGSYYMPNLPKDATSEQQQAAMKEAEGKPWAIVSYHTSMDSDMTMNMIRGLLIDIVLIGLLCYIISKLNPRTFGTIIVSCVFIGMIIFFAVPYTNHIWFKTFDLWAHFLDAFVPWLLIGIVLGAIYRKRYTAGER